jgi:hypothetical protein
MDTWFKWSVTAIYTFVSAAIAAFEGDAFRPFFSYVWRYKVHAPHHVTL